MVRVEPAKLAVAAPSRVFALRVSPANGFVMMIVADWRFALSASVTVMVVSTVAGVPSVKALIPALAVTTGASLTAAMVTFLLAGVLFAVPSLATKAMTRVVVVGFCEVLLYVTACSTVWKSASEAGPVRVSVGAT
jgi:hypothetical protein